MTTVKIDRIWSGLKDTKYGQKQSVAIKTEQTGDKWLSTFKVTEKMKTWKAGDTVDINITENKGYLNFEESPDLSKIGAVQPVQPSVTGKGIEDFEF